MMELVCIKCGCDTVIVGMAVTKCAECGCKFFVESKQYTGPQYICITDDDSPRYPQRNRRNSPRGSWRDFN